MSGKRTSIGGGAIGRASSTICGSATVAPAPPSY
jgi:hypothetical protein